MNFRRALVGLVLPLSCLGAAKAQVVSMREVNGKKVSCLHSGLFSNLKDCDTRSYWYTYVFIGSIAAIEPASDDEKQIQIVPEEIFAGKPGKILTVLTSQSLCLPKFAVGDRWLFYLRKKTDKPIVLDYYGNDSLPVADAQEQIATLRFLLKSDGLGLLRGQVVKTWPLDPERVSGARVIAKKQPGGDELVATTGEDGRYEFRLLSPGEYKVTVSKMGSFQPDPATVYIKRAACVDLTLYPSHPQ